MATLPVISVKSKELQRDLGVKTVRSAKEKLIRDFGVTLIDNEYISIKQLEDIVSQKLNQLSQKKSAVRTDYLSGSSFEDMKD